jgi:hypothetical protein
MQVEFELNHLMARVAEKMLENFEITLRFSASNLCKFLAVTQFKDFKKQETPREK